MPSVTTYVKAISAGAVLCIGGPALVMWVTPTEEEIFKRYNPELQKRALATRDQRQKEFDDFVMQLREASKSEKPIWTAQAAIDKERSEGKALQIRAAQEALVAEEEKRKAEIRNSAR